MAKNRLYHHAAISVQYYILNNKQDDGAVLIVRDDDIKCFFLGELPATLQEALRRADMLLLSAEEHDAKSRGDVVSVLKKKYIRLRDEGRFRQLAQSRGMTLDEYTQFLFGMPRIVPQGNMLDAQVIEPLEKNLYKGRVRILTSPENTRLCRFAENNGLTVDDLIHLYGYTSINDADLDSVSHLPPRSPELDMRVFPARPEGLAEDIFAREPLLGDRLLSQEEKEEVFSRAKKYVDKLMKFRDYDPPLSEQMWITLAVIHYAKD